MNLYINQGATYACSAVGPHAVKIIRKAWNTQQQSRATIQGNVPSKSNCYTIVSKRAKDGKLHASLAKTPALTRYEESFLWQVGTLRDKPISTPFKIYINVIPNDKQLVVELNEKSGGRHQSFVIENSDIVRANVINELKVK